MEQKTSFWFNRDKLKQDKVLELNIDLNVIDRFIRPLLNNPILKYNKDLIIEKMVKSSLLSHLVTMLPNNTITLLFKTIFILAETYSSLWKEYNLYGVDELSIIKDRFRDKNLVISNNLFLKSIVLSGVLNEIFTQLNITLCNSSQYNGQKNIKCFISKNNEDIIIWHFSLFFTNKEFSNKNIKGVLWSKSSSIVVGFMPGGRHYDSDGLPITTIEPYKIKNIKHNYILKYVQLLENKVNYYSQGTSRVYILYGEPGTGKTTSVNYYCQMHNKKLLIVTLEDFFDRNKIKIILDAVELLRPDIILLDDFDRTNSLMDNPSLIMGFLNSLRELEFKLDIFITANSLTNFNKAMLRSERIDEIIEFNLPTEEDRRELCSGLEDSAIVDLIVKETGGYNFADIQDILFSYSLNGDINTILTNKKLLINAASTSNRL